MDNEEQMSNKVSEDTLLDGLTPEQVEKMNRLTPEELDCIRRTGDKTLGTAIDEFTNSIIEAVRAGRKVINSLGEVVEAGKEVGEEIIDAAVSKPDPVSRQDPNK